MSGHRGVPDPAAVKGDGDHRRAAFGAAFRSLEALIGRPIEVPLGHAWPPSVPASRATARDRS